VDGTLGIQEKMYAIFDNHQAYPEYVIHYNDNNTQYPAASIGLVGAPTFNFGVHQPFSGFKGGWNMNPPGAY